MTEDNTPDLTPVTTPTPPKLRQIIIETDGNNINLIKAETSGRIELIAILQNLAIHLSQQK